MKFIARRRPTIFAIGIVGALACAPARADYLAAEAALQRNDFAAAVTLFTEEAQLGNPVAAYNLGKIYSTGALGAPDYVSAATWFRQAAEVGSTPARFDGRQLGPQAADLIFASQLYSQFELAKLYEDGKGVPADIGEAVRWYSRAADQDLDLAQLQLVRLYREGRGAALPADPALATKWLTRLADNGSIAAMNDLGRAYLQGQGVPKNAKIAHDWFEKASSLGSATAAFNLGLLYQAGYLGQPDFLRAAEKYNLGANRKDAQSMAALGDLYFAGEGVPKSNVQAHVWYDLATRYGLLIAAERRDKVAQSMSQAEISTARAMADQWRPKGDFGFALPAGQDPLAPQPAAPASAMPEPALQPVIVEPVQPQAMPAQPSSVEPMQPGALAPAQPTPDPLAAPVMDQPLAPAPTGEPAALPDASQGDQIFTAPMETEPQPQPAIGITEPAVEPAAQPETPPQPAMEPTNPLTGTPQPGAKPFEPATTN